MQLQLLPMKHQHFIPRSYLKNFAVIQQQGKKKTAFAAIYDVAKRQEKTVSIVDICVSSGLYTLPNNPDDRYIMENYYAKHIDEVYPEVYRLLVTESVQHITMEQKRTILNVLLSLYFVDRSLYQVEGDNIQICFEDDEPISFRRDEADEVKRRLREENRLTFLKNQFEYWQKFVSFKEPAVISVCKIEGDLGLITCDNPVTIRNSRTPGFFLWDEENCIQINLDPHHYVYIMPNSAGVDASLWIHRERQGRMFALRNIHECYRCASRMLIGKPGSVDAAMNALDEFNSDKPESIQAAENFMEQARHVTELDELLERYGHYTPPVLKKLWEMKQMEAFKDDYAFQDTLVKYADAGFTL